VKINNNEILRASLVQPSAVPFGTAVERHRGEHALVAFQDAPLGGRPQIVNDDDRTVLWVSSNGETLRLLVKRHHGVFRYQDKQGLRGGLQ
jgi:hypothetical protein